MNRLLSAIAALAIIAVPTFSHAQPRPPAATSAPARTTPVSEIFPYLDRYLGIPAAERSAFRLVYRLRTNGQPFTGRGWYLDPANRRTAIDVAADGTIRNPPNLAMLRDRNHRVQLDVPSGSRFAMNLEIRPNVAPAAEMSATALAASLAQANAGIRRAAGIARFAVPTMTRIVFNGARGGVAVLADGTSAPLPMVENSPSFTPSAMPTARTIRFERAPERVQIAPAARAPRR